jgi:spore germination cell wall hydrolase CwlJ-like protein
MLTNGGFMLQKRLTVLSAVLLMTFGAAVPAMQQNTVIASAAQTSEMTEEASDADEMDPEGFVDDENTPQTVEADVDDGEDEEDAILAVEKEEKEKAAKRLAEKKAKKAREAREKKLAAQKAKEAREAARIKKATNINAKHLSKEYKKKIAKARKKSIRVTKRNYRSRIKAEENALIDLSFEELRDHAQVHFTRKSFDLMCRVVRQEAGPVSYYTQEMVAEVIVHRAMKLGGEDSIYKALTAKGQFSCINSSVLYRNNIDGQIVNACKDALLNSSHPKSLMYFRANYYFNWCKPYKKSEGTYFSLA